VVSQDVRIGALALVILPLVGCTQASPDTRAADEKLIRDIEAQWYVNARAKGADKLVSAYYADDARYLDANEGARIGKDAIAKSLKADLATPSHDWVDNSIVKMEVSHSGDLAFVKGAQTEVYPGFEDKQKDDREGQIPCCVQKTE
jgi:ketosteroid isomerase-like protein